MSVPSMVQKQGDTLIVRSVVSGNTLYGTEEKLPKISDIPKTEENVKDTADLPDCKVKRNYSCSSCDYFTQNPRHYLYHLRDVHKERVRIYECPNCLYASKHFQKLLRHTRMVHNISNSVETRQKGKKKAPPPLVTAEDEQETTDNSDTEEQSEAPKQAVFKCSVCSLTAKTQTQLKKHEKEEHIKTKFFRCTKCTYVTHMKARFTKHVKYHSMPMIKCDLCDFRTPYKWNLDRHCKNHNGKGAFRCSACNFTADIKQSLTVHEMNHHVPPVGQAAGFGIGRRRNKVGASDSASLEEQNVVVSEEIKPSKTPEIEDAEKKAKPKSRSNPKKKTVTNLDNLVQSSPFGADFINPEDIIQHANGNFYIKNKCKLCNFKSAWESEMTRHEARAHNIVKETETKVKKAQRPVPNLIPIPFANGFKAKKNQENAEPMMSQKDFNDICAKSTNSALKDFASLLDSENIFSKTATPRVPDLIPVTTKPPISKMSNFKKSGTLFDKLKLVTDFTESDLTCKYCGHESKCLTERIKHRKLCGTERCEAVFTPPIHNISSSRCQYCRQRCKSTVDLYNHLQICDVSRSNIIKAAKNLDDLGIKIEDEPLELSVKSEKNTNCVKSETKTHPMENKVFVWNNIEVPMDIDVDDSLYEYQDDTANTLYTFNDDSKTEDNVSLDLSIRTQSPGSSEHSFVETENAPIINNIPPPSTNEKIPTHGTDISVAQHKRVFQCPHCTFWASTASRFHVHIVGHLNKKPFECSLCSYRSNWRWDITKHIKLKSVRDPAHESAKVLMTDETGRRNYTKYNKYLKEIHVSGEQSMETSGGSGTRPKNHEKYSGKNDAKSNRLPPVTADFKMSPVKLTPPPITVSDGTFFTKVSDKKRASGENKRTLFKCKKCNFSDASREILLQHVKGHYATISSPNSGLEISLRRSSLEKDEASLANNNAVKGSIAPFRCGHCNQVSNWKHVIQRHCRLKHGGDVRVVSNKNGQEKVEIEEQIDEPDHVDVIQMGTFKCKSCPFSNDNAVEFEEHLDAHNSKINTILKCHYCNFYVSKKEDLLCHLPLHGVNDPEEFLNRLLEKDDGRKRFRCVICPYVTNSKSQYTYHKQFHKPRGGQYSCSKCSYNVSKRHLLHQHLKVHGVSVTPHKQNGESYDVEEMTDEIEEISQSNNGQLESQHFSDIPLVWVSKGGKFTKMYKCRYCPHVNLRKVNIQEHEKMHGTREKNSNSKSSSEVEHHCNECNYICNNAGVLSSHSKVHQGLYGTIHCLVDPTKSDEEQITELSRIFNSRFLENFDESELNLDQISENMETTDNDTLLYFCRECPARFLKENEYLIHTKFHGVRLFYKCEHCSYTSRQKPHLIAHYQIHTTEYQERTKVLQGLYDTSTRHPQPQIFHTTSNRSEPIWITHDSKLNDDKVEIPVHREIPIKTPRSSVNVPLSGTELFQHKSEAEQKCQAEIQNQKINLLKSDPQFGTLMHGNPNFVYPTCLKNGKMKEKRYKCHKCPSAFEKREQYKIHLGLHGSEQKYKCECCDYSVKYYANYVQHKKRHACNDKAQADKNSSDQTDEDLDDFDEQMDSEESPRSEEMASCSTIKEHLHDEKKLYYCNICPYANYRKDAVDNHLKRHISVSGHKNTYTCEICDYSVPQAHFLRDHMKLHSVMDGFQSSVTNENDSLPHNSDIEEKFNNNEGEKYIEDSTHEFIDNGDRIQIKMEN